MPALEMLHAGRRSEFLRHSDQIWERLSLHFAHHITALDLYSYLAGSKFTSDLLVQLARNHEAHHVALTRSQRTVALLKIRCPGATLACQAVPLQRLLNRVEEILVSKGFRQKLHRTRLHRLHRHRNISVTSDEDDGNPNSGRNQVSLKV